jgi:hypothetical protein
MPVERKPQREPQRSPQRQPQRKSPREMQQDIDRILTRLDAEMPEAKKEMDELLARLRTTRIVAAA